MREWADDAKEARESGGTLKAQVGRVFGICVEKKGSELKVGDKDRKYKGRFVFGGDFAKGENCQEGIFNDLGSSPASLEASTSIDALGLLKGNITEIANAAQAYIQALLGTTVKDKDGKVIKVSTWARLPKEYWPAGFHSLRDPVVQLIYALYGHPDSGATGRSVARNGS